MGREVDGRQRPETDDPARPRQRPNQLRGPSSGAGAAVNRHIIQSFPAPGHVAEALYRRMPADLRLAAHTKDPRQ
jgi:hypothetical protein